MLSIHAHAIQSVSIFNEGTPRVLRLNGPSPKAPALRSSMRRCSTPNLFLDHNLSTDHAPNLKGKPCFKDSHKSPPIYPNSLAQLQLKCLIAWSQHLAFRTRSWPAHMLLTAQPIYAIATEPTYTLRASIAVFQHTQSSTTRTVYLNRLAIKSRGSGI